MARESAAGLGPRLALASGWQAEEISYTGTNLSSRDLDRILAVPLVLNLDSLSAIRRIGVDLDVTVDGLKAAALGVMSQGEQNALALSLFIPRATLPEAPSGSW